MKNDLEGSSSLGASHCCLHSGEGNPEGEIHSFTKESLSKCRLIRFLRIKQSLRFSNISLPKDLPTTTGYHARCLKAFITLNSDVPSACPLETNVKLYAITYAMVLDDDKMLEKIAGIDFLAKEVCYHAICRTQYQSRAEIVRTITEKQIILLTK